MTNHIGDTNKMVSDTPRTDAAWKPDGGDGYPTVDVDLARQLERELNAANSIIRQQQLLDEENLRLQERIKRLEEAGDELRECASRIGTVASGEGSVIRRTQEAIQSWDKEAKP